MNEYHVMSAGATDDNPAIREIFLKALELASAAEREAYLKEACGNDRERRAKVEALLRSHLEDSFLEAPAVQATQSMGSATAASEGPGTVIDKYKLLEKLGEGGFGAVYMAEQSQPVKRRVALKIIKIGMDTREVVGRFEAERQALALMDHPNIAKVFDAGATETGRPYFVMELVRGMKVTDYCDEKNLTTRDRLDLFTQVCQAVQHAHQKGIIHRDLKPSNILVTVNDGIAVPKIIDFGIAKATQVELTDKTVFTRFQQFIGTPAYMSPEQAELSSVDIDTRSDIYSLGVLLYELLTGKTPFDSKELLQAGLDGMRRTIREKEPPTPSTRVSTMSADELTTTAKRRGLDAPKLFSLLRGDLDWIVMKCLEKERARRYETANGLARDIERHLKDEPVTASPPSKAYKVGKFVRRNKVVVLAGTVVTTLLTLLVLASVWEARQQSRLRHQAQTAQANEARERAKAEAEAAKSQQVARLLKDMLAGVGPSVAKGRDTVMLREILDKTAERLGNELTNHPEAEIEVRTTLADTYRELGLYNEMEAMAALSLRLAQAHLGPESPAVGLALYQLGVAQVGLSKYEQAEATQRQALALRRKAFGNERFEVTESLVALAFVLQREGKSTESESFYREALATLKKMLGEENVEVADAMVHLADLLREQGKYTEAESLNRQGLEILKKVTGLNNPESAGALHNLALVVSEEGKPVEAEALERQALDLRRKLFGQEHPAIAESLVALTIDLLAQGRPAEAEPLCREAVAMRRKLLGNEHHLVATALYDLGDVFRAEGKAPEAESTYREALVIARKTLGEQHAHVASLLNNLALVLGSEGKLVEAEAAFREALALYRLLLGNDHPYVAASLNNLARTLGDQGKPAEAESSIRESLAICRKRLGENHPYVANALDSLSVNLIQQHRLAEAESGSREALALRRKVQGDAHPEVLKTLAMLASELHEEGKLAEEEEICRAYLEALRGQLPAGDPRLAGALGQLTYTLVKSDKFAAADPVARECLQIREKNFPDDWLTFSTRSLLGASLLGQKQYTDAESFLVSGYEGMKQRETSISGWSKSSIKDALARLVALYETTGRPDQAAEWKKKQEEFEKADPNKRKL